MMMETISMVHDIETQFLDPEPGSAIARARDFGIDLTMLARRLKLTPEERLEELQQAMIDIEEIRAATAKRKKRITYDQPAADPESVHQS